MYRNAYGKLKEFDDVRFRRWLAAEPAVIIFGGEVSRPVMSRPNSSLGLGDYPVFHHINGQQAGNVSPDRRTVFTTSENDLAWRCVGGCWSDVLESGAELDLCILVSCFNVWFLCPPLICWTTWLRKRWDMVNVMIDTYVRSEILGNGMVWESLTDSGLGEHCWTWRRTATEDWIEFMFLFW